MRWAVEIPTKTIVILDLNDEVVPLERQAGEAVAWAEMASGFRHAADALPKYAGHGEVLQIIAARTERPSVVGSAKIIKPKGVYNS